MSLRSVSAFSPLRYTFYLSAFFAAAGVAAATADAPDRPSLRMKSPFAAPLWRLDVDGNENVAVLSSAYKAATVWQIPHTETVTTLRVPLRPEQRKRAHAVAIDPAAKIVALSVPPAIGTDGAALAGTSRIYILDRSTGRVEHIIDGVASRPQALRFSPDGAYLAAVLSSACGLRVWSIEGWKEIAADDIKYGGRFAGAPKCSSTGDVTDYDDYPDTTGIVFPPESSHGVWLVTSGDTGIRSYVKSGETVTLKDYVTPAAIDLERPSMLAASPDGTQMVVGERRCRNDDPGAKYLTDLRTCSDRNKILRFRVAVLKTADLTPARAPLEVAESDLTEPSRLDPTRNSSIQQATLDQVAWGNIDGTDYAFAAGAFPCGIAKAVLTAPETDREQCVLRWKLSGEQPRPEFIPIGTDRVLDMRWLQKRQGLLYASLRRVSAVTAEGAPLQFDNDGTFRENNINADFRGGSGEFRISPDGSQVVFEDYSSIDAAPMRVRFNLSTTTARAGASSDPTMALPDQDILVVRNWHDAVRRPPILNNVQIEGSEYKKDEIYRSVALLQSRKLAVLGSSEYLRILSYAGPKPQTACKVALAEDAYRVNITPDAGIVVSGHSDGALRWHRVRWQGDKCALQLVVTVHLQQTAPGRWEHFAYLPSGQYSFDPSLAELFEWQFTEGEGKHARVRTTPYTKIPEWYDRNAVANALHAPAAEKSLVELATPAQPNGKRIVERAPPPRILDVLDEPPLDGAQGEQISVRLGIQDADAQIWPKRLTATANGTPIKLALRDSVAQSILDLEKGDEAEIRIELPLTTRLIARQIILCFQLDGEHQTCRPFAWDGPVVTDIPRRLWAVIVGIADYDITDYKIPFADNDAIDLAQLFVGDFEHRSKAANPDLPIDYQSLHVDLIVSRLSAPVSDLEALKAQGVAISDNPNRNAVIDALERIADRAKEEDLSNDLFLFFFSGHGFVYNGSDNAPHTAFAMPGIGHAIGEQDLKDHVLRSDELLRLFKQIPGQKLIVIDACRNLHFSAITGPYDPANAILEFTDDLLSAHFLFSSKVGQTSGWSPDIAFNTTRPSDARGNSYFTYALLKTLTDPAALHATISEPTLVKVNVRKMADQIPLFFEDQKWPTKQQPDYSLSRYRYFSEVVRSYRAEPPASSAPDNGTQP
jgi:hypothetical protein